MKMCELTFRELGGRPEESCGRKSLSTSRPSIFRSNVSRCGLVAPWNTFQFSGFRRLSPTARLSMDRLSAAMSARRAGEHLSSPYDGAMRSRRVVVRINQHRHGVHKQTSANLYKGTGSRFAQGISNAAPVTVSGWWFELSRCRRLQAAGNRAMSSVRHRGPARSLARSLTRSKLGEKKICARGSGRGHKNAGRARLRIACSFGSTSVFYGRQLCVFRSRHYFSF